MRLAGEEGAAMATTTIELRNVAGTEAAVGWADAHTVIVDRPEGRAGGRGLGFNGAQLLALSLGGCLCNDLRYMAHDMGVAIATIAVSVSLELDGSPLVATAADMTVDVTMSDGSDPLILIEAARSISMVANSLRRGLPVTIDAA
jgi:organic hydroperoxide reductase OsmC/OhrA